MAIESRMCNTAHACNTCGDTITATAHLQPDIVLAVLLRVSEAFSSSPPRIAGADDV